MPSCREHCKDPRGQPCSQWLSSGCQHKKRTGPSPLFQLVILARHYDTCNQDHFSSFINHHRCPGRHDFWLDDKWLHCWCSRLGGYILLCWNLWLPMVSPLGVSGIQHTSRSSEDLKSETINDLNHAITSVRWILRFQAELEFIESSVQADKLKKLPFPPFKKIFTSRAFWALQIAHIGGTYGFFTLITAGPTYLKNIHHVTLHQVTCSLLCINRLHIVTSIQAGNYSAMGYAAFVGMTFPLSFAAEHLINSGTFRVGTVRKLVNSFGYFGCAAGLVWLSFVGCSTAQAAVALCISVGFYAGGYIGYAVS